MIRSGARITIHLPEGMHAEIHEQAQRIGCTVSSLIQRAWLMARGMIRTFPSAPEQIQREMDRQAFAARRAK